MQLVSLSVLLAVTGSAWASCNAILPDTDFLDNDLDSVSADSAENCCAPCQSNPLCTGFAFADGVCYLKFGQLTRIAKAGVSAATTRPLQCLPWEANVDYFGNDVAKNPNITTPGECCDECAANPACKLYVVSVHGCSLKSAGTDRRPNQDPSWNVRAAYVRPSLQCAPVQRDVDYPGNDVQVYTNVTSPDQCCVLCTQNPKCKLYVASIHGCSLKSSGDKPRPNQNPAWNVTAAFLNASVIGNNATTAAFVDATYSPDIRVAPVAFTTVAGSQWIPTSPTESTQDDLQALVKALNISLAKHKHGVQPEMLITPLSDGSLLLPFTSVASVGECAALVKSHDQTYFTFLADASVCLAHDFTSRNASYLVKGSGDAVKVSNAVSDSFLLQTVKASSDKDCIAQCKAVANCVAARKNSKCTLYGPAQARASAVVADWITSSDFDVNPVANLPTFANATKVAFYVVAHEDDHELFMSNNYHVSMSDSKTKVVFVYTTAGDDRTGGNPWREARELGTLAATKAWVDHVGLFKSTPVGDVVTINGHKIARVTIGNCVHYLMRVPEYGADGASGFMALVKNERPVAPMDDPTNVYKNRTDFKATLAAILVKEANNISTIGMNAQDPLGEQPDHDMHLATGAHVSEIVSENAKWKICVPQKYFYDYQTWNNDVNVTPEVEKLQRYAWLRLSQAIHTYNASVLFWSEHSANLGRTYIRRTINATTNGTC
ncbi:hypothetical protein LEN26_016172 [Aphanomyces euteiches]|nr:hypothetical protein LEN26_016172 [Aphanomyces euteiches]